MLPAGKTCWWLSQRNWLLVTDVIMKAGEPFRCFYL